MRFVMPVFLSIVICYASPSGAPPAPPAPPPAPSASESVTLPPDLDRVLRNYERAWRAKDALALTSMFTEDGYVLSNGKPPVRGFDAIRAAYEKSGGPLWLRPLAYATSGNVGYIVGLFAGEEKAPPSGKFVLALRKDPRGRWLIAADIDNAIR